MSELLPSPVSGNTETIGSDGIANFFDLVTLGINTWQKAGDLLASLIDKDPALIAKIRARFPTVSVDMLLAFERIGRRALYAPLLARASLGSKYLAKMPFDVQKKYCEGIFEVVKSVDGGPDGGPIIQLKTLDQLSATHCDLVFTRNKVLSSQEQVTRIRGRRNPDPSPAAPKKITPTPGIQLVKSGGVKKIGCYRLRISKNGRFTFEQANESLGAQHVRLVRCGDGSGDFETDILFFART